MNKFFKFWVALFGAVDVVFSIFTPIVIALVLISLSNLTEIESTTLLCAGIISAFYRAIDVGILRN